MCALIGCRIRFAVRGGLGAFVAGQQAWSYQSAIGPGNYSPLG